MHFFSKIGKMVLGRWEKDASLEEVLCKISIFSLVASTVLTIVVAVLGVWFYQQSKLEGATKIIFLALVILGFVIVVFSIVSLMRFRKKQKTHLEDA